jgi:hypothetical protein
MGWGSAERRGPGPHAFRSEALRKKIEELRATHRERRSARVAELRSKYGAMHLRSRPLTMELRHHARRTAYLNRARLIAENEIDEPKRAKVLARIDELVEKENARHERHVARLTGDAGPSPSGSAPPGLPPDAMKPMAPAAPSGGAQ